MEEVNFSLAKQQNLCILINLKKVSIYIFTFFFAFVNTLNGSLLARRTTMFITFAELDSAEEMDVLRQRFKVV